LRPRLLCEGVGGCRRGGGLSLVYGVMLPMNFEIDTLPALIHLVDSYIT